MEVAYPRCGGLDVHKKSISACVMIREHGKVEKLERRLGTFTSELEELADWLEEPQVSNVVMEAPGVYWKPVWNVLEGRCELLLANPQHGLRQGSFVPPVAIRPLRDLTRNRARTVQETGRIKNRIHKMLEEGNLKLGSVATDVFGVSGRLMLKQLIAGEQDAAKLAGLAIGRLKKKHDQLLQALAGRLTGHHRRMLDRLLRALETREAEMAEDECDIQREIEPFCKAVQAWMQLPGIVGLRLSGQPRERR